MTNDRSSTDTTINPANWADAAYLEDLAQWADAAVEFFPVHGEKFKEIATALRSAAQPSTDTGDLVRRLRAWHTPGETMTGDVHLYLEAAVEIERLRDAAQAALNPGMREDVRIPLHGLQADVDYLIGRVVADGSCGSMIAASIKEKLTRIEKGILGDAQAALNPGMREALERIRDFPTGGHTAAGAMALIARQALASLPPSQ
jgi:hypothetical protein